MSLELGLHPSAPPLPSSAPLLQPSAPSAGRRDAHQRAAAHRPEHRQLQQRGRARHRSPIGPTGGRRAGGGRPSPPSAAAAAQHRPGGAPRRLAAATAARLRVRRARARCSTVGVGGRHCEHDCEPFPWGSFSGAADTRLLPGGPLSIATCVEKSINYLKRTKLENELQNAKKQQRARNVTLTERSGPSHLRLGPRPVSPHRPHTAHARAPAAGHRARHVRSRGDSHGAARMPL